MAALDLKRQEEKLIAKIQQTLVLNGFPNKQVSLPYGKLSSASEKIGLLFSDLMEHLPAHGLSCKMSGKRVVFKACSSMDKAFQRHNQSKVHSVEYQGGLRPHETYALGINVICLNESNMYDVTLRIKEIIISWATHRRIKAVRLMLFVNINASLIDTFHHSICSFYTDERILTLLLETLDFKVSYIENKQTMKVIDFPRSEQDTECS
jgi:hypothetical protein